MTEHLYILGHPVEHSKSPAMHNALYRAVGLDWSYGFADEPDDEAAQGFIAKRAFLACNVTMPYKPIAFAGADIQAATAKLAGGANVLVCKEGTLIAYNVDGKGCIGFLEMAGVTFQEAKVAVCGTGPTSLAILHACAEAGAQDVVLLGRSKERTQACVNRYLDEYRELLSTAVPMPASVDGHWGFAEAYEHTTFRFGEYASATKAIASADIIIDATPLGMHASDPAPFDTGLLHEGQVVMDTVYGHGVSALLNAATAAGARSFDGAGMLVCQAVDTAQILFDIFSVDVTLSRKDMFSIMASAAGFAFRL